MYSKHGIGCVLCTAVATLAGASAVMAQTHFIETIPSSAAPVFQNLQTFASPAGTGTSRLTFIKVVTDATSPTFQIQRTPGATAQVVPDAPAEPDDNIVEGAVATPVASVLAVTAGSAPFCPALTVASGFQAVCLVVQYDDAYDFTAGPETWQLNAIEDGASTFEYFGWVGTVAVEAFPWTTASAAVTREKIEVSSLYFGGVHTDVGPQFAPVLDPDIRNIGTAQLNITGGPISNDPPPGFFSTEVFTPSAVAPGATMTSDYSANQGIWISANPTQLGPRTSTLTLQSANDAVPVDLEATGVTLYSHFLLDCSGSMDWRPDATSTSVETETRLYHVKQAAIRINNWIDLFSNRHAYTGLSTFGECVGNSTQGEQWVSEDESVSNHADIDLKFGQISVAGLTAGGWTPMQSGLQVARADMNARINNTGLEPNPGDRPNLRQSILLLSDGAETDGNAAAEIAGLSSNGIRVYSIGYGVPNTSNVDLDLLEELADGTDGEFFNANSLSFKDVADAFKNAVTPWLGLQSVADPVATIRAGETASHTACLDPDAFGATFVVEWDRVVQGGISFTLTSPTGQVITPSTPGVSFFSEPTFGQYVLRGDHIRGGNGAGEWRMNLTASQSLPSNEDTQYAWSVLAQTPLEVTPVRNWGIFTGDAYLVELAFTGWTPVQLGGTSVTMNWDAPAASFGTYLATNPVERSWVFTPQQIGSAGFTSPRLASAVPLSRQQATQAGGRAPDSIMGEPASIAQRKAWALANLADMPFTDERRTGSLQMYDDGTNGDRIAGDGIFTAQMTELQFEGAHNYAFAVNTPGLARVCINRDLRLTDWVEVRLSPEIIVSNVTWQPVTADLFFDPVVARDMTGAEVEPGFERTVAVFTPVDDLGNYWGPGRAGDVRFDVTDGTAIGPVLDNWDGSYMQVVEHERAIRPTVTVSADGLTSPPITQTGGFSIPWWVWLLLVILILAIVIIVRRL